MDKAFIFGHLVETFKAVGKFNPDVIANSVGVVCSLLAGEDTHVITSYPSPTFNLVRCDTANDALIKELQAQRTPFLCVPSVRMEPLFADFATSHGMVKADDVTASAHANLASFSHTPTIDIDMRAVTTSDDFKIFDSISAVAFSHPKGMAYKFLYPAFGKADVRWYVAYYNGQAAGCGILSTVNGQAGLYWGGVLPEFRKKGIATNLAAYRMGIARDLGFQSVVAQNMTPSLNLYTQRLGFKTFGTLPIYVSNG